MKKAIVCFSILMFAVVVIYLFLRIDFKVQDIKFLSDEERNEVHEEYFGKIYSTEVVSEKLKVYRNDKKTAIELYNYSGKEGFEGKVLDVIKIGETIYIFALKPRSQSVSTAINLFNREIYVNKKAENVKVLYF